MVKLKSLIASSSVAFASICVSAIANADWQLDSQESSISFISIKKNSVAETHHFNQFAGQLSTNGNFYLNIDLASVDTGIAIRDQRIKEKLFDVNKFAQAKISGQLDKKLLDNMASGQAQVLTPQLTLSLHGIKKDISAKILLQKTKDNTFNVTTIEAIIIDASDFNLNEGINTLTQLAKLPAIAHAIPVNVHFVLNQID